MGLMDTPEEFEVLVDTLPHAIGRGPGFYNDGNPIFVDPYTHVNAWVIRKSTGRVMRSFRKASPTRPWGLQHVYTDPSQTAHFATLWPSTYEWLAGGADTDVDMPPEVREKYDAAQEGTTTTGWRFVSPGRRKSNPSWRRRWRKRRLRSGRRNRRR